MHRLMVSACVGLALTVSACGTTVPLTQAVAGAPAGSDLGPGLGQQGTGSGNPTYQPQLPGAPTSGTTGGSSTGSTGAATGGTTGNATTGTAGNGREINGRGVTPTTITIGIAVPTGEEALGEAFGVSGADTASTQDILDAVVKDVNRSGGVLGRKLAVYVHTFDATAAVANPSQTVAEICSDFRDDHKVFAVLVAFVDPGLRTCLAEMGSPLLVLGGGVGSVIPEAAYAEHGGSFLFGPNAITADRLAQLFVQSLLARSFPQKWNTTAGGPGVEPVKLGLIHVDTPDANALYGGVARELAKHGLRFTHTVKYAQDASIALAATQSAVLKFRGDGITHVFGASVFFHRYAESQRYRPRYAYLPGLGKLGADNSSPEQMKGALTVGWVPTTDVGAAQDPGDRAGGARCRTAMRAAGLSTADRQGLDTMFAVCDALYAFRDAMSAGASTSVRGLRRGYESLGARFRTSLTFSALLGPTRHYGVSSVRDMAYDSACRCLVYTSRTNRS